MAYQKTVPHAREEFYTRMPARDALLDQEIQTVRQSIRGAPPPGRITVGGVLRLDHMLRIQELTGLNADQLASLWDRIVANEQTLAAGGERPFRLETALERYAEDIIERASQNQEVSSDRLASWRVSRRREILVLGLASG